MLQLILHSMQTRNDRLSNTKYKLINMCQMISAISYHYTKYGKNI